MNQTINRALPALVTVVLILGVGAAGGADSDEGAERPLADFEDGDRAGWRAETGEVGFAITDQRSSRGERSLAIRYGTEDWRAARLDLSGARADWRGWDALVFDLYVDGPPLPYLRLVIESQGKRVVRTASTDVASGRWLRCTLPLRRPGAQAGFGGAGLEGVDPQQVDALRLIAHANHPFDKPTTVYVDHVRLVNRTPTLLQALRSRAEALRGVDALDAERRAEVERLLAAIERLLSETPATPAAREQRSRAAVGLREQLPALASEAAERQVRRSMRAAAETAVDTGLVTLEHQTFQPIDADDPADRAAALRTRAVHRVREVAEQTAAREVTRIAIERHFADADFAIGLPDTPTALGDEPYAGAVGRSVSIAAAGNEYEPIQLVLLPRGERLRDVRISASDLSGPTTIDAEHIEVAPMGWRKLADEGGWIADMLRPDIESFDVPPGKHQPVWVNVHIPPDTPAGRYSGTLTIEADGVESQEVEVALTVHPFTLPKHPRMATAAWAAPAQHGGPNYKAFARLVIEHRWNPFQLYRWPEPQPLEWLREQTEMGATLHNLLRISAHAAKFEQGPDGKPRVANKRVFFNKLDPIMKRIREEAPEFMEHVMVYGFDERPASQIEAMDDLYGDFKQRYPGIRTSFADLYATWDKLPELPKHVDVWASVGSQLTPDAVERIQNAGMDVWWYNIYSRADDPVGLRVQYWSTFKDGLDGMLFYALDAGPGPRGRYKRWPMTLRPDEPRTDGGVLRRSEQDMPISTTTFEYWREGMEDLAYLYKLRDLRDELAAATEPGERTRKVRNLLRHADRLLDVPGYITAGLMDERVVEVGEMVIETTGHTDDMAVIHEARREAANLIAAIQDALR